MEEKMLFGEDEDETFERGDHEGEATNEINELQASEIQRLRTINKKLRRKYQEAAQEIK